MNVLLGGGLVATVSGLVMLRSKARQAGAEAEKARAEAPKWFCVRPDAERQGRRYLGSRYWETRPRRVAPNGPTGASSRYWETR